ncbi:hypothetical protein AGR6A_Cc60197 [Agrobacterium sp. NCPPB 925]|nr:hypothetical protein AGR6A_Cc60197 [Agrobacterium sp. NCPPB 925]
MNNVSYYIPSTVYADFLTVSWRLV